MAAVRRRSGCLCVCTHLEHRFDWFYLGGLVEARLAHHREAAQLLAEAVNVSPSSLPARLALADALFESGDLDGARRQYRGLTSGRVRAARTLWSWSDARGTRNKRTGARKSWMPPSASFPNSARHGTHAAWCCGGLAGSTSEGVAGKGAAVRHTWPAVEDPIVARVRGLRDDAAAHSDRAFAFQRQGNVAKAIEEYEAAVAADPKWVRARVNLIALYGGERQWGKAEQHFQALVDLGLRVAEGHYNFAVCWRRRATL